MIVSMIFIKQILIINELIYIDNVQNNKRKADELGYVYLKIQQYEKEIEHLKIHIQSLKEIHNKELENQAEMFRRLLQEQKDEIRQRLINATTKIKLLNRQKKRRDTKIDNLLKEAKDKKILNNQSYDILNKDFRSTFAHIVHKKVKKK